MIVKVYLDLDNTMIHVTKDVNPHLTCMATLDTFNVYSRPRMKEFLLELLDNQKRRRFCVGVWSAGETKYVHQMLHVVCAFHDPDGTLNLKSLFDDVLTREHTTRASDGVLWKDLARIDNTCILVDDNTVHALKNPGRVVLVTPFIVTVGDAHDDNCFTSLTDRILHRLRTNAWKRSMTVNTVWTRV